MLTLFATRLTDTRAITTRLRASGQQWQEVTLSMRDSNQRAQWAELKEQHGWQTLPMVVDGDRLIGGQEELDAFLAVKATRVQTVANVLGLGGLIPFVGLAVLYLIHHTMAWVNAGFALLAYAATILSFVGALQWAFAVVGATRPVSRLVASVMPSLVAWAILLLPYGINQRSLLFAAAFVAWYAVERFLSWSDYPLWFQRLRRLLTGIVATTLAIVGLLG
ncbi:MAG: DUF3429 domain-containing protein [Pseudomonadota bacterium]